MIEDIKSYAEKIVEEGNVVLWAKKYGFVRALKVKNETEVKTYVKSGLLETTNTAKENDWIVTKANEDGSIEENSWVVEDSKFNSKYQKAKGYTKMNMEKCTNQRENHKNS